MMNLTFEQLMILLAAITTSIISLITAWRSNVAHKVTQGELSGVKQELATNTTTTNKIEQNTNSTLTLLQNKVDALMETLKQTELVRAAEAGARDTDRARLLSEMQVAQAMQQAGVIPAPSPPAPPGMIIKP
jgi:hypothetical protein